MASNVKDNLESLGCIVTGLFGDKESIKKRFIDLKSQQHLIRIDQDKKSEEIDLPQDLTSYDAIVISDYDKGSCSYDLIVKLIERFTGPIFLDTKKTDLAKFNGCFVKINDSEFSRAISYCSDLIVTKGDAGAVYQNKIFPVEKVNVIDVCGAGDTFLAALAFAYLKTSQIEAAISFANKCASIVVSKLGVHSIHAEDIKDLISDLHN
jgi:D-beta-D-heptose 7-phosphate kinase/D-beta-D-heptose 1-phosphate adenosyltransferase